MPVSFHIRHAALAGVSCLTMAWGVAGCGPQAAPMKPAPAAHTDGHGEEGHHHHHHAEKGPHNGTLVAIGEDAAHLELVLDADAGKLTAYVLDAEAKNAVPVKQASLELAFTMGHGGDEKKKGELPNAHTLTLAAVSPSEGGEATEFAGQSDELKAAKDFDAVLSSLTVAGKDHKSVEFNFPKGNEHDHHHH